MTTKSKPSLTDRLRSSLLLRGLSVAGWAEVNGWHASEVWHCLAGRRVYPDIRDAIAGVLGVTRATVDRMIPDGDA